ncbi:MAG: DUF2927 domain-containing protein [Christensenellales bacterium]
MEEIFCSKCGNKMPADASFCGVCGSTRASGDNVQQSNIASSNVAPPYQTVYKDAGYYAPPPPPNYGKPAKTGKTPPGIIAFFIVSLVILIGALGFGAWRLWFDQPQTVSASATPPVAASKIPKISATKPAVTLPVPSTPVPTTAPTPAPTPDNGGQLEVQEALTNFNLLAFSYFTGDPKWDDVLIRWETPIRVEVYGEPTDEDMNTINSFLIDLSNHVPQLDIAFLEGDGSTSGNMIISFVPLSDMGKTISDYDEGDWGSWYLNWDDNTRFTKAQIAIASDVTNQAERNHMIREDITHCLGLKGYLPQSPESILYSEWSDTQALTEKDYFMIKLLYSDALHAGQHMNDVNAVLPELILKLLGK